MKPTAALKIAAWIYDRLWPLAIPLLRRHRRLADGFGQRIATPAPRAADVWIQAASAGEAYLALALTESIRADCSATILLTTNTRQGAQILQAAVDGNSGPSERRGVRLAYFPLDRPTIMQRAVAAVTPEVMVLLETEIWPGHLLALKRSGSRILLVNGRLTPRSLKRYRIWPGLWPQLSPDAVLAVSPADAERFARLFATPAIATMPNMKFDRIAPTPQAASTGPLAALIPARRPFIVLGSIRKQEEQPIARIITAVLKRLPRAVIGLFPRHMERIDRWQKRLDGLGFPWQMRSRLDHAPAGGSIILWDRFGELAAAYALAKAAFVGGSLVPLGGQNFLEPLMGGVVPVIGPSRYNFDWVGPEIVPAGLLQVAANWQAAAALLVKSLAGNRPRTEVRAAARDYIDARRGGTRQAAGLILEHLESGG